MNKKIAGIFVCTLIITTTLTATSAMNNKTTWYVNEDLYPEPYQNTPANSIGVITINIVAKVVDIDDDYNLLGGRIHVNDTITGKYTYNSWTSDTNSHPKYGVYPHNKSPYGIEIKAGEYVFKTNPSNVDFRIAIQNDIIDPYYPGDFFAVTSYFNLNLSNELVVDIIIWILWDDTGKALSSDALPKKAPVLSDWNQSTYGLNLIGYNISDTNKWYYIQAIVIEATKSKVRDIHFTINPFLIWLCEHHSNLFQLIRYFIKGGRS